MTRDITINDIKIFYQYKYRFIDVKNGKDIPGYIYNINRDQYFIDDKETYFRLTRSDK